MAVGDTNQDMYLEVGSNTRPESKLQSCCVNRQRLHSIITGEWIAQ